MYAAFVTAVECQTFDLDVRKPSSLNMLGHVCAGTQTPGAWFELAPSAPTGPEQDTFVKMYGNDAAADARKSQERFGKWLLTGFTLAGALLLGSYLSRR